jgi:hypothetical protein
MARQIGGFKSKELIYFTVHGTYILQPRKEAPVVAKVS